MDKSAIEDRIGVFTTDLERRSAGRTRLLPVTKAFPASFVKAIRSTGLTEIAENYAQELLLKSEESLAGGVVDISWHMIGGLQRNKVRRLVDVVTVWQTVDRVELIDEIAKRSPGALVLLQVDGTGLPERGGCAMDSAEALVSYGVSKGLDVRGLMTVGLPGDNKMTQRIFQQVADLAEKLGLLEISMGMSGDFKIAVDCGSTIVRVGQALFGSRPEH